MVSSMIKLQGIYVDAATPFDYDGAIYKVKVQHNVEKWSRTAISGYCFAGSAGEGPLLREEEKLALWEMAAGSAGPGKTLLADVSTEGVEASAFLAKRAASLGFHAVIAGVPHFYKSMMYGPETQMLYYRALADRSPIPVIIENAPGYTGVDVLPETACKLSAHPNIIGVIERGTPAGRITQIRQSADAGFAVLGGSATNVWESLEQGASGAILALASATPHACITLWEAFRTREQEAGLDWQAKLSHPGIVVTDLYGISALKYAMELMGYYGGPPRLPYCPASKEAKAEVEASFRNLRG